MQAKKGLPKFHWKCRETIVAKSQTNDFTQALIVFSSDLFIFLLLLFLGIYIDVNKIENA